MTSLMENIFKHESQSQTIYNRRKTDYLEIYPTTNSAQSLNQSGTLQFELNNQQSFIYLPESYIYAEIEITKQDGTILDTDITLECNWFPKMFNSMRLDINSNNLENLENIGELDLVMKLIMTSKTYKNVYGELTGYIPDTNTADIAATNKGYQRRKALYIETKKFGINWYLSPAFGFLDYRKI